MNRPEFTVAICTLDRATSLQHAVASVAQQDFGRERYEILVVDNGSADDTPTVITRLAAVHANLRAATEPVRGVSAARNRALAEARAPWIVFIDDDATACAGFLAALARTTSEERGAVAIGGRIDVEWSGSLPSWYEPGMDPLYGRLDLGPRRRDLPRRATLYGSNLAASVAALRGAGGFAAGLGRVGRNLAACEDTDAVERLRRVPGGRVIWEPALRVVHHVDATALTPDGIEARARAAGASRCAQDRRLGRRFGVLDALSGFAESWLRIATARSRGRRTERLVRAGSWGYLSAWRRSDAAADGPESPPA